MCNLTDADLSNPLTVRFVRCRVLMFARSWMGCLHGLMDCALFGGDACFGNLRTFFSAFGCPREREKPYNHMTTQQFRETVALGSRRPHVERRWPRSIQRLLKRCWDADPSARPSFREILDVGTLEQARVCYYYYFYSYLG